MKRRRRGSGTIETFRNKEGEIRYRARVPREDGTREPLGVYPTHEAAELAIDAARSRSAELVRVGGARVKDYGKRFLDNRETARIRGIRVERNRWANLVDASPLGELPMSAVTRADAKDWLRWLLARRIKYKQKHPKNGKRLERITRQNVLNLVRKAFDEAVDDLGLKGGNPFAGLKLEKNEGRTHEPWTWLTIEEQGRLYLACRPAEWPLVTFAVGTGLRQAEQWSLRWEDVAWAGRGDDAIPTKIAVRYGESGKATKGGRVRHVPLLPVPAAGLKVAAARREKSGTTVPLVFPNQRGARRFKGEPSWWKALLKRAGLDDPKKRHDGRPVRWHDLRHTCATSLLEGWWGHKWSLRDVQAMLGHRSITTTERYGHLAGSSLDEAAKKTKGPEGG